MKLKSISFENYKAFKEKQTLEIRPITILIGKNSSGKSAIAKLFTLFENSLSRKINEPLRLNNNGVELGAEFSDLVYGKLGTDLIKFSLTYENNKTLSLSILQPDNNPTLEIYEWRCGNADNYIEYKRDVNKFIDEKGKEYSFTMKDDFEGFIPKASYSYNIEALSQINNIIVDYIGPFRILPKRQFYLSGQLAYFNTGVQGENAYAMLANSKINKSKFTEIVGQWYKEHFDGWELTVKDKRPYFEIILSKEVNGKDLEVNIVDVGQGMNQALPLVVRAYSEQKDSIIVLEQPELHLHPAAHADLAELFAWSAKKFEQSFIIETHSENILLRLRKLVVENDFGFTKDDVIIYWVDNAENGGQQITPITIDEEGTLSTWPDGVFTENVSEIIEMRKTLKKKKAKKNDIKI